MTDAEYMSMATTTARALGYEGVSDALLSIMKMKIEIEELRAALDRQDRERSADHVVMRRLLQEALGLEVPDEDEDEDGEGVCVTLLYRSQLLARVSKQTAQLKALTQNYGEWNGYASRLAAITASAQNYQPVMELTQNMSSSSDIRVRVTFLDSYCDASGEQV